MSRVYGNGNNNNIDDDGEDEEEEEAHQNPKHTSETRTGDVCTPSNVKIEKHRDKPIQLKIRFYSLQIHTLHMTFIIQ